MALDKTFTFKILLTADTAAAVAAFITAVDAIAGSSIMAVRVNSTPYSPIAPFAPNGTVVPRSLLLADEAAAA